MRNFAREHFQKYQAVLAAEKAAEYGTMQDLTAYEQQLMQLNSDQKRLEQIQSRESKIALKAEIVPTYKPYITGILQSQPKVQDEVVTTLMVWAIDVADYDFALDIAEYVIANDLVMSDRFSRKPTCIVVEEISEAYLKDVKQEQPQLDFAVLQRLYDFIHREDLPTTAVDMPDEVRAKLYVAMARYHVKAGQLDQAKLLFERALQLSEKCGCRTEYNRLIKSDA